MVLSLLTLFLMMGTAYIVTANHYRRMNKALANVGQASDTPALQATLLDEVVNQLLRDTNNPTSALRYHSLLRDMYGTPHDFTQVPIPLSSSDGLVFRTPGTHDGGNTLVLQLPATDGQFVRIDMSINPTTGSSPLRTTNSYYNGQVLTFVEGAARGQSVRIVNYRYLPANGISITNPTYRFVVMQFEDPSVFTTPFQNLTTGDRVVINGRPFNGTGVGFNSLATGNVARLNALEQFVVGSNAPLALVPNPVFSRMSLDPQNLDDAGVAAQRNSIPDNYQLTAEQLDWLNTNFTMPRERNLAAIGLKNLVGLPGLGGSDESYDVADFQNMALAMLPLNPGEKADPTSNVLLDANTGNPLVIPSFHRPALINFWWKNSTTPVDLTDPANVSLLRKILLRPNWFDHPEFTGSNPDFDAIGDTDFRSKLEQMIYGPWDVDNDNDGFRDSQWVDFGAPVMQLADGTMVKPLAAILVLDQDGRLSLNAHGTRDLAGINTPPTARQLAGATMSNSLPRGLGFGPAEISILPVVGNRFGALLSGVTAGSSIFNTGGAPFYERDWAGRYGFGAMPGVANQFDLLAQMKMQGVPYWASGTSLSDYTTPPDFLGRYGVGLNALGQPAYEAIDDNGNNDTVRLNRDSPYEADFSVNATRGHSLTGGEGLYTLAELERILRAYDVDVGALPERIWELANGFKTSAGATTVNTVELNKWRTLLTTDSYDLPVPNVIVPQWMLLGEDKVDNDPSIPTPVNDDFEDVMGSTDSSNNHVPRPPTNVTFSDLLEYRVRIGLAESLGGLPKDVPADHPVRFRRAMGKLLPPDLADGLRLDINRAIGNGRDDNNNGVVDEPGEWRDANNNGTFDNGEQEASYWAVDRSDPVPVTATAAAPFEDNEMGRIRDDIDRDGEEEDPDGRTLIDPWERGDSDGSGKIDTMVELVEVQNFRRQMLARHLYTLALTLVDPLPSTATADERRLRAERLAQWAVNVVDYRDPDNCMTPFEFDVNPFDGWDVDGDLTTKDDIYGTNMTYDVADPGGLVWGAERPELLMTETLAWHDRRTRTGNREGEPSLDEAAFERDPSNPQKGDVDSGNDLSQDQEQRPRGAAFIELYNPWPANPAANADTHDKLTSPGNDLGVDLARTHNFTPTGSPVWRIMAYKDGGPHKDPDHPDMAMRPDNDLTADEPVPTAHRSIYFTGRDPGYTDDGVAFFNELPMNPVPNVRPGRYLVIGGGEETSPGSGEYLSKFGENNSQSSARGIELRTGNVPSAVSLLGSSGSIVNDIDGFEVAAPADDGAILPQLAGDSSQCVSSVAIIDQTATGQRSFNLSEPAAGYPRSVDVRSNTPASNSAWDGTKYVPVLDRPLDDQRSIAETLNPALQDNETRLALPADEDAERTIPGFSWLYLQRLANPLLPFNADTNPYLTVDSMGANVTVFNGLSGDFDPSTGRVTGNEKRLVDGAPRRFDNVYAMQTFASVQRGRSNNATIRYEDHLLTQSRVLTGRNLTLQEPGTTTPPFPGNLFATERIDNNSYWRNRSGQDANGDSLGDGNEGFTDHFLEALPDCTLGFLNEPFRRNGAVVDPVEERLMPKDNAGLPMPFPWLAWNNRPFVSENELLQVPAFRSSQLLHTLSFSNPTSPQIEKYGANASEAVVDLFEGLSTPENRLEVDGRYGHLQNFFRSKKDTGGLGLVGLHRLLDYLHVPSRFVGTETWLNPAAFGDDGSNPVLDTNDPRYQRQPPFNRISNYRDPGRVNLNTMINGDVWLGVSGALDTDGNGTPDLWHSGPLFDSPTDPNIIDSRRGYGVLADGMLTLNSGVPTFFANPFRTSDASTLVPIEGMLRAEVDCALNRSEDGTSGLAAEAKGEVLFASKQTDAFNNTDRNPYFRYQPLTRLANLTTTRSNVYAIWVTIGFFEVEEFDETNPVHQTILGRYGGSLATARTNPLFQQVYPDGYLIGEEAGSDTGVIERIREFAIVDRTIPVAFEPGKNHNVDRAIRLRRRIE